MPAQPNVHYRPRGPDTANFCYAGAGRPAEGDGASLLWFVSCEHCLTQLSADVLEARRQLIAFHMSQGKLQSDLLQQLEASLTEADVDRQLARVELLLFSNLQESTRKIADALKAKLKQMALAPAP